MQHSVDYFGYVERKKTLQSLRQNITGEKSRRLPTHGGAKPGIPGEEQCCSSQSTSYTALNLLNRVL